MARLSQQCRLTTAAATGWKPRETLGLSQGPHITNNMPRLIVLQTDRYSDADPRNFSGGTRERGEQKLRLYALHEPVSATRIRNNLSTSLSHVDKDNRFMFNDGSCEPDLPQTQGRCARAAGTEPLLRLSLPSGQDDIAGLCSVLS